MALDLTKGTSLLISHDLGVFSYNLVCRQFDKRTCLISGPHAQSGIERNLICYFTILFLIPQKLFYFNILFIWFSIIACICTDGTMAACGPRYSMLRFTWIHITIMTKRLMTLALHYYTYKVISDLWRYCCCIRFHGSHWSIFCWILCPEFHEEHLYATHAPWELPVHGCHPVPEFLLRHAGYDVHSGDHLHWNFHHRYAYVSVIITPNRVPCHLHYNRPLASSQLTAQYKLR